MRLLSLVMCYYILNEIKTNSDIDDEKFCKSLDCDGQDRDPVCGFRTDGKGIRLKVFDNECTLMKQGCFVNATQAFGIINLGYCKKTFPTYFNANTEPYHVVDLNPCDECTTTSTEPVCAIRREKEGFIIKLFMKKCDLMQHNCKHNELEQFNETESYLCDRLFNKPTPDTDVTTKAFVDKLLKNFNNTTTDIPVEDDSEDSSEINEAFDDSTVVTAEDDAKTSESNENTEETRKNYTRKMMKEIEKTKNLIVFHGSMFGYNGDVNETMNKLIAATHLYNIPIKEVTPEIPEETRRSMHVAVASPIKVFKPWIVIPKNVSDPKYQDVWHIPTLSSCYHKCPTSCPDTYVPVCGTPGVYSREPALMFQNHCFMDATQCKIRWEDASPTADIASYIESSFIMCLGDTISSVFRFLPLVRTLQHMGRLKKKGVFKYKFKNLRFFNNLLQQEPKLMGK